MDIAHAEIRILEVEGTFPSDYAPIPEDHAHLVTINVNDIIKTPENQHLFCILLCQINTMKKLGIKINRFPLSKDKEIYVMYTVPYDQCDQLQNVFDNISELYNYAHPSRKLKKK